MTLNKIYVTKLSSAKRQLKSAIRMFFMQEDDLAIHTIASAVYSVLKDIKRDRGRNEVEDLYQSSFFYLLRDYRRGLLPAEIVSDNAFVQQISEMADKLGITADLNISDFKVSVPPEIEKEYWKTNNFSANFLKHADRDVSKTLDMSIIDNHTLLAKCVNSYRDVAPDDLDWEGMAFAAYVSALNSSYNPNESSFGSMVQGLRSVPQEDLKGFCYELIKQMYHG